MLGIKATKRVWFLLLVIALALGLALSADTASADEGQPTITTPTASAPTGAAGLNTAAVLGGMPVCGDQSVPGTVQLNCPDFTQVDVESYQVPGIVGTSVDVTGNYVYEEAAIPGWVEVFVVDDANGTINGVKPGTSGWAAQVASRNPQFLFGVGSTPFTPDVTLQFHGGDFLGFRYTNSFRNLFYSFRAANGGTIRMRAYQHTSGQPWQFAWEDGADGDYNDMVVNLSAVGQTPPPTDTTPPTVSITEPADGTYVQQSVQVTAAASDDVGVAGVQFQLDGQNLGDEQTASPYSVPWDTTQAADGQHTLTAVAHDAAGNLSPTASVTVNVLNHPLDGNVGGNISETDLTIVGGCASTGGATGDVAMTSVDSNSACAQTAGCKGSNARWGTANAQAVWKQFPTGLVMWRYNASVKICVDLKRHYVLGYGAQTQEPSDLFHLIWSYDNHPVWTHGLFGSHIQESWVRVTDSFTGCPFIHVPFGCNHKTLTITFHVFGTGKFRPEYDFN
jgi:hypothetical protein